MRFVALLRGVNVGGKNLLPMKTLARCVADAGGTEVTTFIQSGNALFTADTAEDVARRLPGCIADAVGFAPPVVVRSAPDMARITGTNPFVARGLPADRLYVAFLADAPSAERIASLDPARSPPDEVVVVGAEAFLYLPNGAGRSKITAQYLDSRLATTSTARNWRTVSALAAQLQ